MGEEHSKIERLSLVSRVFTPGAPIDRYALFAGRREQVLDVVNAVNQRGQHVILFGERGVGKTSLANVLSDIFSDSSVQGLDSGSVNCDGTDDFSSIWHKVFRELVIVVEGDQPAGFQAERPLERHSLDSWLDKDVTPDDIRFVLQRLPQPVAIIIDEVDRIRDRQTTTLLADTVKNLSDHSVPATLILVGVADSVDQLIAEHQSVERALTQIPMPRMSMEELFEILEKGLGSLKMKIDDRAQLQIAHLSEGLPHYTHLLGLHASQRAIQDDRDTVSLQDVGSAIQLAVNKAQQSIRSAYHLATSSPRKDTLYETVLLACALAPTDALGYFTAGGLREPMYRITGRRYEIPAYSRHLNEFAGPKRGPVLEKTGTAWRFSFRFINPMMQPFIILRGLAAGTLSEDILKALKWGPETT